jgi:tetratricopeptide (TPR) repeat protein
MSRATLEISMIVKNEAATLARTLASVAAVADRVLVADTGSSDNTIEIARQAGADVVQIPWEQNFAKARNRALAEARCDWIFSIDADEMLDEEGPAKLRALLEDSAVDAYDVVRWNYVRTASARSGECAPIPNPGTLLAARIFPAYVTSVNTRLFRRLEGVYFDSAVHESVVQRLAALGKKRAPANFILHHLGQAENLEELRQQKNEFYHQLGLKKLHEEPHNDAAWFEVGLSELEFHKCPTEALTYLERARALNPTEPRNSLFCGIALTALHRLPEALARMGEAYGLGLRTPVLYEAIGDVYFHAGNYELARQAYEQGGVSPLNAAKLGACETMLGQKEAGLERIQRAIASAPDLTELYDILAAAALVADQKEIAHLAIEQHKALGIAKASQQALVEELQQQATSRGLHLVHSAPRSKPIF